MKLCKFGTSVKDPVVKTVVTTIQFQQSNNSTQRFNCIVFLCICLFPEINYYWNQTFDSSQTYYYTKEKANRRLRATYIHIGYAFHIFAQLSSNAMLCMYVRMCECVTYTRIYELTHMHAHIHVHVQRKFQHAHASLWYCVPVYFSHVDICYLVIFVAVCVLCLYMHIVLLFVYMCTNQFSNVAVSDVEICQFLWIFWSRVRFANKKRVVF